MKSSSDVRYPNSVNLFHFCRRIMDHKFDGVRVIDQDVGQILGFDPADCSHWKKGKKNIRSIQAIKAIAEHLNVDERLVVDVATGLIDDTEAFIEFNGYGNARLDSKTCEAIKKDYYRKNSGSWDKEKEAELKNIFSAYEPMVDRAVAAIHERIQFSEAPLYLPELLAGYPTIKLNPISDASSLEKLAVPILFDVTPGGISITFQEGTDTKAYMRYQIAKTLAEFFLPEDQYLAHISFTEHASKVRAVQCHMFASKLLTPAAMVRKEMANVNVSKDVVSQLADALWVSKIFMNRRLKEILQSEGEL